MAAGLPQPAVFKIPVKQVAIETYNLVWEHRRRIAYWSIVPFILGTLIWIGGDKLASSGLVKGSYILESTFSLFSNILGVLVTVPFQVAIHRLTYPGFDFDRGSHGPPLNVVNKFYFSRNGLRYKAKFSSGTVEIAGQSVPAYCIRNINDDTRNYSVFCPNLFVRLE